VQIFLNKSDIFSKFCTYFLRLPLFICGNHEKPDVFFAFLPLNAKMLNSIENNLCNICLRAKTFDLKLDQLYMKL
jgi:hypothetical protein